MLLIYFVCKVASPTFSSTGEDYVKKNHQQGNHFQHWGMECKKQDMVNRLVNTERKYGMEINIDRSQVMRVSSVEIERGARQIKVNNREI